MKVYDIIAENSEINEAPMGILNKAGAKLASFVPGKIGAGAKGKLETGNLANQLRNEFYNYLGKVGEEPSVENITAFLQNKGYPTTAATKALSGQGAPRGPVSAPDPRVADAMTKTPDAELDQIAANPKNPTAQAAAQAEKEKRQSTAATQPAKPAAATTKTPAEPATPQATAQPAQPAATPKTPEQIRIEKQKQAAAVAQGQMAPYSKFTPAPPEQPAQAAQPAATPSQQPATPSFKMKTVAPSSVKYNISPQATTPAAAPAPGRARGPGGRFVKKTESYSSKGYRLTEAAISSKMVDQAFLAAAQEAMKLNPSLAGGGDSGSAGVSGGDTGGGVGSAIKGAAGSFASGFKQGMGQQPTVEKPSSLTVKEIISYIDKLDQKGQAAILKYLKNKLEKAAPAATPAPAENPTPPAA